MPWVKRPEKTSEYYTVIGRDVVSLKKKSEIRAQSTHPAN